MTNPTKKYFTTEKLAAAAAVFFGFTVGTCFTAFAAMLIWNQTLTQILELSNINYYQSLSIVFLCKLLLTTTE